jgi:endonuclease/exonuclease/phosphatase family metal-dependent hydrolase
MDVLRVCTWNIKQGQQLPTLLSELSERKDFSGLDVMAIQESFLHNETEDALVIAKEMGSDYECYQVNVSIPFGIIQGNAVIWNKKRLKIAKKASFFLPDVTSKLLPYWERALLRLIPKQERNCIVLDGRLGTKTIRIYVTHFDVLGFYHKMAQLDAIFAHEKLQKPTDICLVVGDFNTFKFVSRPSWRNMEKAAEQAGFTDLTTEIIWTFSRKMIRFRQKLDSIFIKPANFPYKSWSLDIGGSDHIPVFSDIEIR